MKKIITLLFLLGFLTSAFAQSGRHRQDGNKTYDNRSHSPEYSGDNDYEYSKSHHDNTGYHKNNQWKKRNNDNDYGYNKDRDNDRDDMRRNQYYHPQYGKQKRNEYYQDGTRPKVPLLKALLFGMSGIL